MKTTEQTIMHLLRGVFVFLICMSAMHFCCKAKQSYDKEMEHYDQDYFDEQAFLNYHRNQGHNVVDY